MKVPKEFLLEQYGLKASYFSSKIETLGYLEIGFQFSDALKQYSAALDWETLSKFGIDPEIFKKSMDIGLKPAMFFCHPNILLSMPSALKYYRNIAALPQKGLKAISNVSSVEAIENGRTCTPDQAIKLTTAINNNLNFVYRDGTISDEKRMAILFATAGASLDGSWRNAIGKEGERFIRSILIDSAIKNFELQTLTLRNKTIVPVSDINSLNLAKVYEECTSIQYTNGAISQFGSEPDVTCCSPSGETTAGVEVKAGLDPAGALERLGAMLKSFEHLLSSSNNAETILVASCITDEVQRRLNSTKNVSRIFILTDLVQKPNERAKFNNLIRSCLKLTKSPL